MKTPKRRRFSFSKAKIVAFLEKTFAIHANFITKDNLFYCK